VKSWTLPTFEKVCGLAVPVVPAVANPDESMATVALVAVGATW
jgi:hypothetical protein